MGVNNNMNEESRRKDQSPSPILGNSSGSSVTSIDGNNKNKTKNPPPPPPPGPPPASSRTRRHSTSPLPIRHRSGPSINTINNPTKSKVHRNTLKDKKTSNYQYALHEFNQTIEHSLSNDDGLGPGSDNQSSIKSASGVSAFTGFGGGSSSLRSRSIVSASSFHPHQHYHRPYHQPYPFQTSSSEPLTSEQTSLPTIPLGPEDSVSSRLKESLREPSASKSASTTEEFSTATALAVPSSSPSSISSNLIDHPMVPATQENLNLKPHVEKLEQVEQNDGQSPSSYSSYNENIHIQYSSSLSKESNTSDFHHLSTSCSTATNTNHELQQNSVHNSQLPDFQQSVEISDDSITVNSHRPSRYRMHDTVMPDATYEERYGDAYVGKPIRYIYPSGFQSMRPRGSPWKLSLVIFFFFIWLCVFIVGHCSDQAEMSNYINQGEQFDDDVLIIETRWCGSRTLYSMWVVTVLITALAASYCSIIGYIKMRDFSVANGRSQPPGMVGKSEYYVKINDHFQDPHHFQYRSSNHPNASIKQNGYYGKNYHSNIYQSDGTPQFWGGYIYRPTQAAVAVTSR